MKLIEALSRKRTSAVALAEAEKSCEQWESLLRHFVGDSAVQCAIQAIPIVDEGDTVKGRYIAAVSRIRWREFCLQEHCH